MKKLFLLGLCFMAVAGASAQKSLVKEVEGKSKGFDADFAKARTQLAPALTDAETKDDAQTWYVAGTIEFGDYDSQLGKKAVGQAADDKAMGESLVKGYEYFMTAFPLDTIPEVDKTGAPKLNKDGSPKVKTKYSKDMAKKLAAHYNDYASGGQFLWEAQDYPGAYKAWSIYTSLPQNPSLGKDAPAAAPDSIVGQIYYFQGLAAWQAEKLDDAIAAFRSALKLGYNESSLYDYAIGVAAQKQDEGMIVEFAQEANKVYGDTTTKYLAIIINDKINKEKYDEAMTLLEQAIAVAPNNAELYDVRGILYQSQKKNDEAQADFEKAVSLNPDYMKAQLDLGRVLYAKAVAIEENAGTLDNAAYNKLREDQIDPLLKQAVPYLENALNNEQTESDARRLLRSIYYTLDDEANLKRIEAM